MAYNAASRRDNRELEKLVKLEDQQRKEVISGIMSVAPGRKWICELFERCHIFGTSIHDITNRMAFFEGQREVAIWILNDVMRACPSEYVKMMEERNARQSTIDARLSRKDRDGGDQESGSDDGSGGDDSSDFDDDGTGYYDASLYNDRN